MLIVFGSVELIIVAGGLIEANGVDPPEWILVGGIRPTALFSIKTESVLNVEELSCFNRSGKSNIFAKQFNWNDDKCMFKMINEMSWSKNSNPLDFILLKFQKITDKYTGKGEARLL